MTRWVVVPDGRGWTVVGPDGERVRERWAMVRCIDAQVIAAELQRAYEMGREEARREVFSSLAD